MFQRFWRSIEAYSQGQMTWVNKGSIQPLTLETIPLIRSNTNQSQADIAIASNGLVCTVYTDNVPVAGSNTFVYKYAVADSVTGQNIIAPTVIVPSAGVVTFAPRVFVLGNYFVIVFATLISAAYHLQRITISTVNPSLTTSAVDISTSYTAASTGTFNGVVASNNLYLAWNGASSSGIKMTYIDRNLNQFTTTTFAAHVATNISMTADTSQPSLVIWVASYNSGDSTGYVFAVDQQVNTILAQTLTIPSGDIENLAISAENSVATLFYEVAGTYSYDSSIATNHINKKTITQAGVVSSATTPLRGVGLASNAFIINSVIYFVCAYGSTFQPTYFVSDSLGNIVAKLAYSNGGGYTEVGVPNPTVIGSTVYFPILFKDLIQAVNKDQGVANAAGIYSQTGINLATVTIGTSNIATAEIGNDLHLSGGFLWMYDGYTPVEHMFHVWPDSVEVSGISTIGHMTAQEYFWQWTYEWADNQGNVFRSAPSIPVSFTILTPPATFVGNRTSGSPIISAISSTANLQAGQAISGTGIPADTFILSVDSSSQITMSANASSGSTTSTTITPVILTSVTCNVPMLRLTYKIANPVKLVGYRWSTAQQEYFQTTLITLPQLNDPTTDSLAYIDTLADSSILGNNLIYTTGGVLENIAMPAVNALTLFDTRLWAIDAEDQNLLWNSKQVIENVPVETSDLLTTYVSPSTSAQGNTGPMKCISPMDDKLIIFKRDAIYYLNGTGPDNTGANSQYSQPTFVTSTVGCSNQNSIVMTPNGLMFQSDKGIWLLGRDLGTSYIGAPVEDFNQFEVQSALNVPGTNQVRFTLSNDVTLMYDYYFNQWGTFHGIPAISSIIYQNLHTFMNSSGQIYQETPGLYLDGSSPVLMSFVTGWINPAGLQGYQRAYRAYILGEYQTPHALVIGVAYDYDPSVIQQPIIYPSNYNPPWGGDTEWGGPPDKVWGGQSKREQWQVNFQRQTCEAFQISFSERYDPQFSVPAGAGLTLSGMNLVCGIKKSYPRNISAANKTG